MKRALRLELLIFGLLLAVVIGVALLLPAGLVVSSPYTDLANQFASWRAFAASSLRSGHLPLWNPYSYAGMPFLGEPQSALFYPPNVMFLFLPLERAINLSFLSHLLLLGAGMYYWARRRGLHPLAAALCGLALPLSGAVWPHVYAGHLSNLCTMAWAPWIFAGLESWWNERRWGGLFEASAGICLQIFAGHTQYVYFTGIAAGAYSLVCSVRDPVVRRRALPGVAAAYAAAAALAAVQLLPGFAAAAEGVRQGKMSFADASIFFFPVENFVTLFAPGFFEHNIRFPYWGRWYISEMYLFVGASGVVLAGVGFLGGPARRAARRDLLVAALLLLLALGSQTPLYRLLYEAAPGLGQFRGMSKFTFPAMLFLVLAIGAGLDAILRGAVIGRVWPILAAAGGAVVGGAGLLLCTHPEVVAGWVRALLRSGQSYLAAPALQDAGYLRAAGIHAGLCLMASGALFILVGASLAGARRWSLLRWVPVVVFPLELIAFASTVFVLAPLNQGVPEGVRTFFERHPSDNRVLNLINPQTGSDSGFLLGAGDIWGNDPLVLRRYAEFITATQGYNPDHATQNVTAFRNLVPPIYAMLRCQYIIKASDDYRRVLFYRGPEPMARAQLVSDYRVLAGRNALFATMARPEFDPRRLVLLETEPSPRPVPSAHPGTVRLLEVSPDALTFEADVASPALLLITDLYSRDWRAVPLPGSSQQHYEILPANYILRAVPLAAGHHHLRVEYAPASFRIGSLVSLLAGLGWIAAGVVLARKSPWA